MTEKPKSCWNIIKNTESISFVQIMEEQKKRKNETNVPFSKESQNPPRLKFIATS